MGGISDDAVTVNYLLYLHYQNGSAIKLLKLTNEEVVDVLIELILM